ncbi:hypothetical protein JHK87_039999 [Glycine soja]|nr:hypothetical protein JHK87_039999 [Glycine soja]
MRVNSESRELLAVELSTLPLIPKDVVLARVLDEATVANLNSMIHANNAIDDNTFIQELFARLKSLTTSPESKKNMGPRRMHYVMDFIPATAIEIGDVAPIQTVG